MATAIRPDPTRTVERQLLLEFGGWLPAEAVRRAAREAVEHYAGARVTDFVSVLALRRARARLRQTLPD